MAINTPIQVHLHIEADALAAAMPVLAKTLISAIMAHNQQDTPTGIGQRPWMELPDLAADPNWIRVVRYTGLEDWVEVVPGLEVHVRPSQYDGAHLEFRFKPAGGDGGD